MSFMPLRATHFKATPNANYSATAPSGRSWYNDVYKASLTCRICRFFMPGAAGAIKPQQLAVHIRKLQIPGNSGNLNGLFSVCDGLRKVSGFGIGGGQGSDH